MSNQTRTGADNVQAGAVRHGGLLRLRNLVPLNDEEASFLASAPQIRREFAAHDTIYEPDGTYSYLTVVESGWAEQFRILPDGRKQILGFLLPGDLCGKAHALARPDCPSIAAITSVKASQVPIAKIQELAQRFPRLVLGVLGLLNREEMILQQQVVSLGRRSALEAMMHLLLELQARLRAVGQANSHFVMPLTQNHLADCLGLSAVHVNRTLVKLRADGLISINGRQFVITDQAGAEALADFDAAYLR